MQTESTSTILDVLADDTHADTSNVVKKKYVHCLNSTLTATSRTMCAILENYQTPEGVNIPEPLRKYLPGFVFPQPALGEGYAYQFLVGRAPEFIPFVKELPKNSTSQKKAKADKGGKPKAPAAAAATNTATAAADAVGKAAEKLKDTVIEK